MKRRTFLTHMVLSAGALLTTKAIAATSHSMGTMPMSGHKMDHGCMSMSDHNMGMMKESALLAESALPTGLPLPKLKPLKNSSKIANQFVATLRAKAVSVSLTDKVTTEFWAYNDQIPGPAIDVFEGDTVKITLKNELPQATTIHWHGLPVSPDQDGNPQDAVPPGGSHTYTFTLPKGSAGTYWYHPHGHETVAEQAFRGLAGVFIVRAKEDPLAHLDEQNWLMSDLKLASDGSIAPNSMMDWMNGREGQFVLFNGASRPSIVLKAATRVRLWNACSGRYLNLALADADIYQVGTDGGLIPSPVKIDNLLLSPGERAEIIVVPRKTTKQPLQALAYERGKMGKVAKERTRDLAMVTMQAAKLPLLPDVLRPLPTLAKATAFKSLEYTETMDNGMNFLINGKKHDMNRVDLTSKVGEVEEWTVFNNSHMDHNFHIHGTQFHIVEFNLKGQKRRPVVNGPKDTVNLKPYEKVRLQMVQQHKGLRMYHCHILEHETLGMMGQLNVI